MTAAFVALLAILALVLTLGGLWWLLRRGAAVPEPTSPVTDWLELVRAELAALGSHDPPMLRLHQIVGNELPDLPDDAVRRVRELCGPQLDALQPVERRVDMAHRPECAREGMFHPLLPWMRAIRDEEALVGSGGLELLISDPNSAAVEELELVAAGSGDRVLELLSDPHVLPALRTLRLVGLDDEVFSAEATERFASSELAERLERVELAGLEPSRQDARCLRDLASVLQESDPNQAEWMQRLRQTAPSLAYATHRLRAQRALRRATTLAGGDTVRIELIALGSEADSVPEDRLFGPPPAGDWPRGDVVREALDELTRGTPVEWDEDDRLDHLATFTRAGEQVTIFVPLIALDHAFEPGRVRVRRSPPAPPSDEPLPADVGSEVFRRRPAQALDRVPVDVARSVFDHGIWWDESGDCSDRVAPEVARAIALARRALLSVGYLGGAPTWLQGERASEGFVGQLPATLSSALNFGAGVLYVFEEDAFSQS